MSCGAELTGSCETCALRNEGFFCALPKESLKGFDTIRVITDYPAGTVLFAKGERALGVHVLCKGRVKLTMTWGEGRMVVLRIVNPGEVIGLHAVVSGQPYQATAETLEPCQVNFVRHDIFLKLLTQNSEACIHAARQLSGAYESVCDQVRSLGVTRSASTRLARFLLESSVKGQETKQGIRVRLTMTHDEIGQVIGTSRESVTRTLGDFRDRNLVVRNGSRLVIQNRAALESLAGA